MWLSPATTAMLSGSPLAAVSFQPAEVSRRPLCLAQPAFTMHGAGCPHR